MGIVEKLSQLIISKSNLRNKINEKISDTSKQIPEDAKLDDFTSYVDNIESGGGSDDTLVNIYNDSCNRLFYNNLSKTIPFIKNMNVSACSNFYEMFGNNINLEELDMSRFDTGAATNMQGMFENCPKIKVLNLSKFKFIDVTRIDILFKGDIELEEITFGNELNTSKVINMHDMFYNCKKLKTINTPNGKNILNIDMSSNSAMWGMFQSCSNLEFELNIINGCVVNDFDDAFRDSGVKAIRGLIQDNTKYNSNTFRNCPNLVELDFTGTTTMPKGIDVSTTGLDRDGLMNMLNTLPAMDKSNPITITIGSTKKALLENIDILQFALKGYTLA